MKQGSLDEPGLGMEFEGGDGNNAPNNEGEGEGSVFMKQANWTQIGNFCDEQINQLQTRPDTPQLSKGKGKYIDYYI